MNSFPLPPDASIDEAASLWAARLEGEGMNQVDRTELETWLAADTRHRTALAAYCQLSTNLEQQLPSLVAAGNVTMPAADSAPTHRSWRVGVLGWLTAGALAAAAVVFVATLPTPPYNGPKNISSPIAQRQSVTLEDGSTVDLNAHTNMVVEQTEQVRRVRLATGQAFFQVTKDNSRPFIVETPAGAIRVTGTAFDVRTTSAGEIEVTVLEGSVQVHLGENNYRPATSPYALTAGDQLTSNQNSAPHQHHLSPLDVQDTLAWRDGEIVVAQALLGDVVARFAHYHGIGISASPRAAKMQVAGRFGLDNLDGFLSSLEENWPVVVTHDESGTIRVKARD